MDDVSKFLKEPSSISIIIPVWNQEDYLKDFCVRLTNFLGELEMDSEVIFVDNYSDDSTFCILRENYENLKGFKLISLKKNYGQHLAIMVGMHYATKEIVIIMNVDPRFNIYDIQKFIDEIVSGYSYVFGRRIGYNRGIIRAVIIFFIRLFTNLKIDDPTCPFRAIRSDILAKIKDSGALHSILAKLKDGEYAEVNILYNNKKYPKISHYKLTNKTRLFFEICRDIIFKNKKRDLKIDSMVAHILIPPI